MKIGQIVKFKVNTLHGLGNAAGTIKRILPDGRLEVKAQQGGYYTLRVNEVVLHQVS